MSSAFKRYCRDTDIKLEFGSPNSPQQIGANERVGRTIAVVVRCLLADSGVPKFLWGKLMLTAVFRGHRAPTAALAKSKPDKTLYGKDAHVGHLRVIEAGAFVHVENDTKKLERRTWEGGLLRTA